MITTNYGVPVQWVLLVAALRIIRTHSSSANARGFVRRISEFCFALEWECFSAAQRALAECECFGAVLFLEPAVAAQGNPWLRRPSSRGDDVTH